jgi:hypothetical protein
MAEVVISSSWSLISEKSEINFGENCFGNLPCSVSNGDTLALRVAAISKCPFGFIVLYVTGL